MNTNAVVLHNSVSVGSRRQREPLELLLYWRSVYKRKWWIVGIALLCGAISAVAASLMTPLYRATVTLMVQQNRARVVSIEEVYSGVSANREHYQTQAEMLKSPALAEMVIHKLALTEHPEFDPRQQKRGLLSDVLSSNDTHSQHRRISRETVDGLVRAEFLRRIAIDPIRQSQLVKLSFDSADPQLAARVANAIADAYLEMDIEVRAKITQRAGDWLAERLTDLKQNLEQSERVLQQFREREGLLDTRGLAQGGVTRHYEVLLGTLADVKQRRNDAEQSYSRLASGQPDVASMPTVLNNPQIDRLKSAEADAERHVAALANRYGSEHPRRVAAERVLAERRENTRRGIESVIASYRKEFEIAYGTERATAKSLAAAKGAIQDINHKEFQLEALQRDVDTNRQIYERFLNRYREMRAAGDTQSSVVARIVDPAIAPSRPYKPKTDRIVMIGAMLGFVLGTLGAFFRERLDSTIKSSDDVEEKLGLPTLTVLPLVPTAKFLGRHFLEEPSSLFSEAIRTARTSLLLSSIDLKTKILLVTSSVPSEGKSAFAVNLALSHAQTQKVLLVEADLRRPSIAQHLALDETKPGLTSLFGGTASFAQCVHRVEGSSLYVLPAGTPPANPSELISSDRFRHILERVASACDMLILDSPPLHLVSDAVLLSTLATGVVFVVKADSTPYPIARRCIKTLDAAGAPIIGVALNHLDFSKAARYYGGYTEYATEYGGYCSKPTSAS